MGKKQKKITEQKQYESKKKAEQSGNGLNMQSLLDEDMLNKLKAVAQTVKQEQAELEQQEADKLAEIKKAEQKRLENDFAYLLEHSDPKGNKYK